MQYQFDNSIDRAGTGAAKYEDRERVFGSADVLPLWVADMDIPVMEEVSHALQQRAAHGIFGYTTRPDSYFEAVCHWQERHHGWKPDVALCSFNAGVIPAMNAIIQQLTKPGDAVVFQPPVYPPFFDVVQNWGRKAVLNPLRKNGDRYEMDYELLEQQFQQEKPAMFLLCSPHNPVGRAWSREELERLGALCVRYNVIVIADEIHADLQLWGGRHIPFASLGLEIGAITITCTSATKTFNLAGLQASTTIYPNQAWKKQLDTYWHDMDIHRNNCFSQVAVEAAYRHGDAWLEQLLRYIEGNMQYVKAYLEANLPQVTTYLPEATYLLWLDFRGLGMDADATKEFLIHKARLGLNDGRSFGAQPGFFRLNTACPRSMLEESMRRLQKAAEGLK